MTRKIFSCENLQQKKVTDKTNYLWGVARTRKIFDYQYDFAMFWAHSHILERQKLSEIFINTRCQFGGINKCRLQISPHRIPIPYQPDKHIISYQSLYQKWYSEHCRMSFGNVIFPTPEFFPNTSNSNTKHKLNNRAPQPHVPPVTTFQPHLIITRISITKSIFKILKSEQKIRARAE